MTSFDDALRIIHSVNIFSSSEEIPVLDSMGRVVFSDIYSKLDFPAENNSAMDGYAINSALTSDIPQSGLALEIEKNTLYAGMLNGFNDNASGKALKIMTGAYLPPYFDAVIPFEEVDIADGKLLLKSPVKSNKNVRKRGEDIKTGDKIVSKNSILDSGKISLLVACGIKNIIAYKKLNISVISSGDEILSSNDDYCYGKVFNSNGVFSELFLNSNGCRVVKNSICKDSLQAIKNEIGTAIKTSDIIITSAGASFGEKDFTEKALSDFGFEIKFRQVAIKPAKPFSFGLIGKIPVFMIPGNPIAFFTCLVVFVKPFLEKYYGRDLFYKVFKTKARFRYIKNHKRREFIPAYTNCENGCCYSDVIKKSGPAMISVLGQANSIIDIPEDKAEVNPEDYLSVYFV